ncbi:Cmx (plasmid) [Streptantibioticus cattleyicolor NRRL 8057 = DSM 46488]|uniref:Cmx n=1 Tax=Streptantibioticus cattleyicolor (strain ATCC 35852 / DSM 46488 / JCM 4925 / NBRC 14057 / NRRL 8057) TaxID=1003195 RepID=G8XG10_STREN|nr:Cmx [Streptantibioticus cattleyicolor NRRL 8057 = DSM 46488]
MTIAGRFSDRRPLRLLAPGGAGLCAGWALLALAVGSTAATVPLVLVQGALSFAVGSTLVTRALYAAGEAPSLGGSFATAALNVGAAVGPALAGAALGAGSGYRSVPWLSAGLVASALATAAVAGWRGRR